MDADATCKACGRPVSYEGAAVASDALMILRAAVGQVPCNPCVCDVDTTGTVTASDALVILKQAVGMPVTIRCPAE